MDGGLYDQHPLLVEQWQVILEEKAKYQKEKDDPNQQLGNKAKGIHVPRKFKR